MHDAVDDITDAWRAQRPDLDVDAIGVTTRVRRLARRLDTLRADVLRTHGLNDALLDLLATLRRAGAPHRLPVVEIRRRTLVTAGAVTMRVDRAVAAGLVDRLAHPDDARQREVALTRAGLAVVDAAVADIAASEAALLADLDADDRVVLDVLLRRWLAAAEG